MVFLDRSFDSAYGLAQDDGGRAGRCAMTEGGRKLRLVEFSKEFVEPDWCSRGHIGYVLEGQMEVNFDGKVIVFGP
ncbi:MAG: hypothetical protein ACYS8I_08610, partial [Planctomycetota bacterium]